MDKANRIAGVKDVITHLDNCQARFVGRCDGCVDSQPQPQPVKDPIRLGDIMPVGFGDDRMIYDELMEEDGRKWNDYGQQWVGKEGKKDGFVSTLTRMTSVLLEGSRFGGDRAGSGRWISKK